MNRQRMKEKTSYCRNWWKRGDCKDGDDCDYVDFHQDCSRWERGQNCTNEDCRFFHDPKFRQCGGPHVTAHHNKVHAESKSLPMHHNKLVPVAPPAESKSLPIRPDPDTTWWDTCENGTLAELKQLLERKQDPNEPKPECGWTGLRCAVCSRLDDTESKGPNSQIVTFLASITNCKIADQKGGLLPIHEAARQGKSGFFETLALADPASLSLFTRAGLLAQHYAVQVPKGTETKATSAMVRFLLSHQQVDAEAITAGGNNALHYLGACLSSRSHFPLSMKSENELWQLLLRHGIDDQLLNAEGHTAIGKLFKSEFQTWKQRCEEAKVDWTNPPSDLVLLQTLFRCSSHEAQKMCNKMAEQNVGAWPVHLKAFREFRRDKIQLSVRADSDGHGMPRDVDSEYNIVHLRRLNLN